MIALPPPNITGELHMGHALNGATQDTLIRLKRMQGFETQWICGTDHASIAVHAVIERQLRAEGKTRWDLGRDAFIERVWEWRATTGATIIQQFKRLGCTLDYDHERFTMDDGYVRAVLTMFVELYDKGYIYRDNRLINWCPTCASTISDLEVRYQYRDRHAVGGALPDRRLGRVDDGGDRAPRDDRGRYGGGGASRRPRATAIWWAAPRSCRWSTARCRSSPTESVKIDFGTGALKVTPGHATDDFEIGRRHGLAELSAIGYDGRMTELAGEFAGMTVAEARHRRPRCARRRRPDRPRADLRARGGPLRPHRRHGSSR